MYLSPRFSAFYMLLLLAAAPAKRVKQGGSPSTYPHGKLLYLYSGLCGSLTGRLVVGVRCGWVRARHGIRCRAHPVVILSLKAHPLQSGGKKVGTER